MQTIIKLTLAAAVILTSCSGVASKKENNVTVPEEPTVKFNADSAYSFIKKQVDFGPRVPGSDSHARCADYLIDELKRHGIDTVYTQTGQMTAFNGDILPIKNIIGSINPEKNERVLIAAHYDTRPWADNESDEEKSRQPIDGANDGASGAGVILELARILAVNRPEIGVDFLLVDAEDYGNSSGVGSHEDSWCLGTQYWCKNDIYTSQNRPKYGIVLDMVGGRDARFHREYYSVRNAAKTVDKVWGAAARAGFSSYFPNQIGGALIDDHLFISRNGIPCIDIVECNNARTGSFPATWHTHQDNMSNIDTAPLRAVGQTVLNVLLSEKGDK
ncbi:MAG: M28 family peptidase [Paramuribaculum sp.]|nr:M28 family peptidase [Paramuribaculum sp.]